MSEEIKNEEQVQQSPSKKDSANAKYVQALLKENGKLEDRNKQKDKKILNRNIVIVLLIIIIILLLFLRGCAGVGGPSIKLTEQPLSLYDASGGDANGTNSDDGLLYVTMPVVTDFTVTKANPGVLLYCPVENTDLFRIAFTFTDKDGKVVYQSSYLSGGQTEQASFIDKLPVGNNIIHVSITSEYEDTGKPANGAGCSIIVTVKG